MAYCRQCGKEVGAGDKFCKSCGASENAGKRAQPPPAIAAAGVLMGLFIFAAVFYFVYNSDFGKTGSQSSSPGTGGCKAGSAPAVNDHSKCCPTGYSYYWSSDGKCHKYQKCPTGSGAAVNNPSKCCPSGYPYYWGSDGKCHTAKPAQPSNADVIANANTLVRRYQAAVAGGDWDVIITVGQELEVYMETYYDILITDIYFEENMDDLIDMIDGNDAEFEEVCRNGGSYSACTTPISDTATLSCQGAEQRFRQDYVTVPPESMTVSYLRSQIGLIDEVILKCTDIRSSEQVAAWNSARGDVYASLAQLEQTCNSMSGYRPPICN